MKFLNNSKHGSKLMLCKIKRHKMARNCKGPLLQQHFTEMVQIFNQLSSSSVPISIPNIKALAHILFEISC